MARSRIIIGFRGPAASLVYLGSSGSEADAAMVNAAHVDRFEILEGPGRRKNNPRFDARLAATLEAEFGAPILVLIGDEENSVGITVYSEAEEAILLELVEGLKTAGGEIERLGDLLRVEREGKDILKGELSAFHQSRAEAEASFAKSLQTHLDEIATLKAQAASADAEFQGKIAQITDLASQVSALKTQLEEAQKTPPPPAPEPEPAPKPKKAKE